MNTSTQKSYGMSKCLLNRDYLNQGEVFAEVKETESVNIR